MLSKIYVALIHYPVLGRKGGIVSSSVTNLDVHDIARTCRTYKIKGYFVVTNLPAQREIVDNVLNYWLNEFGKEYNPSRSEALAIVESVSYIEDMIDRVRTIEGCEPRLVFTSARKAEISIGYGDLSEAIMESTEPHVILFGTSWGLPQEVRDICEHVLEPIRGSSDFNHLSVRSAVAIVLDRIINEMI